MLPTLSGQAVKKSIALRPKRCRPDNILMLVKRRPSKCMGFVENKYRHENVMITTFIKAFYEPFAHALKKPGVLPHPLWNALSLLNQLLSQGWSIGIPKASQDGMT